MLRLEDSGRQLVAEGWVVGVVIVLHFAHVANGSSDTSSFSSSSSFEFSTPALSSSIWFSSSTSSASNSESYNSETGSNGFRFDRDKPGFLLLLCVFSGRLMVWGLHCRCWHYRVLQSNLGAVTFYQIRNWNFKRWYCKRFLCTLK